jgi:hypothetical protein
MNREWTRMDANEEVDLKSVAPTSSRSMGSTCIVLSKFAFIRVHSWLKSLFLPLALSSVGLAETVPFTPSQDSDVYAFFDAPSFTPDSLNVGADPTEAHAHRSLVQFNLASLAIPAAEIGSAKLRLFSMIPNSSNGGGYRPGNVSVHRQAAAWSLNPTLRWNHIQPQELAGTLVMTAATEEVWVEADITELVKQWVSGAKPNYGVVLKPENESAEPLLNVEFASMELNSFKPQLVVTRAVPAPVPPVLAISGQGGDIVLEWPLSGGSGWTLQEAASPGGPWTTSAATPVTVGAICRVTCSPTAGGAAFFRLYKP